MAGTRPVEFARRQERRRLPLALGSAALVLCRGSLQSSHELRESVRLLAPTAVPRDPFPKSRRSPPRVQFHADSEDSAGWRLIHGQPEPTPCAEGRPALDGQVPHDLNAPVQSLHSVFQAFRRVDAHVCLTMTIGARLSRGGRPPHAPRSRSVAAEAPALQTGRTTFDLVTFRQHGSCHRQ